MLIIIILISFLNIITASQSLPECDNLYCSGRLIDLVMNMRIFNDSKTFVDLKLKQNANLTMTSFNKFIEKYNNTEPPSDELKAWLLENFDPVASELIPWNPTDFKTNPEVLNRIRDKNYKKFASDLNHLWIELSRKMKDEVCSLLGIASQLHFAPFITD